MEPSDVSPYDSVKQQISDFPEAIRWDIDIPLLTNKYMLIDMGYVLGISLGVTLLILIVILGINGEKSGMLSLLLIWGGITIFIIFLFAFTMGVVLRNRIRTTFLINAAGVDYASVDLWANFLIKASIVAGTVSRNPTVAGAGLLATSKKRVALPWKAIHKIRLDPHNRVIILRDSWHPIQRIYCHDENWQEVVTLVRRYFTRDIQ